MPSLESGSRSTPWRDGVELLSGSRSTPWRDGVELLMVPSPFVPPPAPPGSTPTGPSLDPTYIINAANSYEVVHAVTVTNLSDNTPVDFESMTISTDDGSVCWSLTATGPAALFSRFATGGGVPPVLSVMIDGIEFRFIVEGVQRNRQFGRTGVSVRGRSVTIAAGEPYQLPQNWINQGTTSAAQLIDQAQFYTGMQLTWLLDDWLVPDKLWSFSGTPLAVAKRVAESVSAIVLSDRTQFAITVMPRYESLPSEWPYITPDVGIHVNAFMADSYDRSDRPAYNGVYVSGQQQGVVGFVFLAGTTGDLLAPLVTDLLLTDVIAVTQRGQAILGSSGPQARVTLTLPVLTGAREPGVLGMGMLCRITGDEPQPWWGVVRSVTVNVSLPSVTQTVVLERHTAFVTGTVIVPAVPAITMVAPVPASGYTGVQSGEFTVVGANLSGNVVVTPASTLAGTFSPVSVTLSTGVQTGVFRLTPTVVGVHSVGVTNNSGVPNPAPVAYTATAPPPAPPTSPRVTEPGDLRITESGDRRITE